LTVCETAFQHVDEIVELVGYLVETGKLPKENAVGLDIAGLPELLTALELAGYEQPFFAGVGQGWQLQNVIRSLPLRAKSKLLRPAKQGLFAWSVGNAKVELKRSNQYITKELAGAAKIDVVIGLLNAAQLMFGNPVPSGRGLNDFLENPVRVI